MLTARLADALRIRSEEGRPVALLVALMLLLAIGANVGTPSIEALFFSRFGVEFLPYMYVVLGAVTIVTALGITALLGRVSRVHLYRTLPPLLGLLLLGARLLVALDLNWFYPVLWVGNSLFYTLQALLAWGLAGLVFDTRQAKRLFPLFAAGSILGSAAGGLLTRPLVAGLGTENLLLVWAAALLGALALVVALTRGVDRPRRRGRRSPSRVLDDLQIGWRHVRGSALLRWISLAAVLYAVLFFSLAFPFSKAVAAEFPREDRLTGFLGVFQGVTTSVALLLSLFLANRLYARVGFMGAILAQSALYLTGFSLLAINGAFVILVAFRFCQMSWMLGVSSSAYQATFNVVPGERREQTRAFIDGVPTQAGVALTGLLLLLAERTLTTSQLYLIGAGTAVFALFAMWRARGAYNGALVDALRAGHPHVFFSKEAPFGGFQQDAAALAVAVKGVSDPDPAVRRIAAEILGNLAASETTHALVAGLDDADPEVRAAMLRGLARIEAAPALLEVTACLFDPEAEVRRQAVITLRALTSYPKGLATHVRPLLDDVDPAVRAAAAVALLGGAEGDSPPDRTLAAEAFRELEKMATADDVSMRVQGLEGLAASGADAAFDLAAAALGDAQPAVRRAAAAAVSRIDAHRCVVPLVRALGDRDRSVREAVARAIGTVGADALPATLRALQDPALESGALRALGELPVQGEADAIRAYAERSVASALEYDLLWRLVERARGDAAADAGGTDPDGRDRRDAAWRLLADSLAAAARSHGANGVRAVGLLADREAVALAVENLGSRDATQRANAVEILDSIAEREVIRPALPLWERGAALADGAPGATPSLEDGLLRLLGDPDPWLRACAALVAADGVPHETLRLREELCRLAQSDPDPLVRGTSAIVADVSINARESAEGGPIVETLPTLSQMERILFLRRVPLFLDLPPVELKQVADVADELFFVDEEVISHQDEPGDEMYIIVSGEIRVVAGGGSRAEEELARRKAGDYVGEMAIISDEPRMATLVAAGDVRVLRIGQQEFEGILRERPEISLAVMRVLCDRLRERDGHG